MLALLQRQPNHLRRIFGYGRATADLMAANNPSGPTSSNMTRHFIPNSRLQRPGGPIAPPTFRTVSARAPWLLADRRLITAHCQDGVFSPATLVDLVADRLDLVPGT